jgi:hypothetical protein
MISQGRARGEPVLLQKQWEVSRAYAYFATPVAYLIDSTGLIAADAAVGVDPILDLLPRARQLLCQREPAGHPRLCENC